MISGCGTSILRAGTSILFSSWMTLSTKIILQQRGGVGSDFTQVVGGQLDSVGQHALLRFGGQQPPLFLLPKAEIAPVLSNAITAAIISLFFIPSPLRKNMFVYISSII